MNYYIASFACLAIGIGLVVWTQISSKESFAASGSLFFLGVLLATEGGVGTFMYSVAMSP